MLGRNLNVSFFCPAIDHQVMTVIHIFFFLVIRIITKMCSHTKMTFQIADNVKVMVMAPIFAKLPPFV